MNDIVSRHRPGRPAAVLEREPVRAEGQAAAQGPGAPGAQAATPEQAPLGEQAPPGEQGPPGEQAPAAALFTAISVIRRSARRAARQAWTQQPLPPAQSELLRLAAARPGITVADAAQELRLAPNTVSTLVGRLTEAGLLGRERGAPDGRTARLTATEKTRQRLAEFRDLRAELAGRALARLPEQDQKALAAAVPALLRLAERMETQ